MQRILRVSECYIIISVSELDGKLWFGGDKFSAIDILLGYNMCALHERRYDRFQSAIPELKEYYERVKQRPLFQQAFVY